MKIHPRLSVVATGLLFIGAGLLFLANLHLGLALPPAVLWPVLIIAWGTVLLVAGMADHDSRT